MMATNDWKIKIKIKMLKEKLNLKTLFFKDFKLSQKLL